MIAGRHTSRQVDLSLTRLFRRPEYPRLGLSSCEIGMQFILAATEPLLADAWHKAFQGVENVQIHQGSIFDVSADALVSPANSFGFMDGGIDAQYSQAFGWDLSDEASPSDRRSSSRRTAGGDGGDR
jgi:hypothetical protein